MRLAFPAWCRSHAEMYMSNDNLLSFSRAFQKRNRGRSKVDPMAARIEGCRVLSPVVENLREMGLSYSEIGRFFTLLGHELYECASQEEEPHEQSMKPFVTGESTGTGCRVPIEYAQWAFRECRAPGAAVLRPAAITPGRRVP